MKAAQGYDSKSRGVRGPVLVSVAAVQTRMDERGESRKEVGVALQGLLPDVVLHISS